ncbi:hypothetical protein VMUT_0359 [Vulcanisaeta moutnovskia 768-28]|uniref:DUF4129 domain-containing protein n=1 Tax=Vulcanisaeta moutnovskia (strain 768-28) TaxID=985053 RepID=F0QTV6_VULM7|nr:DUF4129 domain-containing protein [Vulcanisaeta moutnovskia]ADY00572.1 hypothetical protein VMUT_0359 [Vulcanisaeta moutnovskia 768-28]
MNKSAILVLIIGLLITWLLTSSIGTLIKINESGSSQGTNSLNIHINLPQPAITLPPINITITQHINGTSGTELYVPLIPLPIIMPNIPINITKYLELNLRSQPIMTGGAQDTLGSQGGSGSNQQYTNTVITPLRISPILIIIVIIIAIIIISTGSLTIIRRESQEHAQVRGINESMAMKLKMNTNRGNTELINSLQSIDLMPGETVRTMSGWGGSAIIDLPIPKDLPLIWSPNIPLPIAVRENPVITVSGSGILRNGSLIMPSVGCYGLSVRLNDNNEMMFIRASNYRDDVIKFIRLNMGNFAIKNSVTIREAFRQLINEGIIANDNDSINRIIKLFEDVRYGLKDVDRHDYEEFLRALSRVFKNARVIVCESSA